jgi:hypothetical protein
MAEIINLASGRLAAKPAQRRVNAAKFRSRLSVSERIAMMERA